MYPLKHIGGALPVDLAPEQQQVDLSVASKRSQALSINMTITILICHAPVEASEHLTDTHLGPDLCAVMKMSRTIWTASRV